MGMLNALALRSGSDFEAFSSSCGPTGLLSRTYERDVDIRSPFKQVSLGISGSTGPGSLNGSSRSYGRGLSDF